MLSSLVKQQAWVYLETSLKSLAQFKCFLNKAVLVFLYSFGEFPMYMKKHFMHKQFIYRSKPLPCIGKVDICFDNSLRP